MSSKKKSATKAVRIRMYNVGFGDAFLLFIPDGERDRRVLVDCGSISSAGTPMKDTVQEIIQACAEQGKASIDVIVLTHRHMDHISGFANAAWKDVEVGEVWMPWTEDPKDPRAKRIRDKQLKLAENLQRALTSGTARLDADKDVFQGMVLNASVNESAMQTAHRGFSGNPLRRFLPADDSAARTFKTQALPGVTVHVLGPSREESVIRDIDPPEGESYLRVAVRSAASDDKRGPFGRDWAVRPSLIPPHLRVTAADIKAIGQIGDGDDEYLAATLDRAINGTSLVLVFEIGELRLLFPGDAQWGTWRAILADSEWVDLIRQTSFLKVGHHGSHNASPTSFIEKVMPNNAAAMISTKKMPKWPRIPRQPLIDRLIAKKTRLARSDTQGGPAPVFRTSSEGYIEARIPIKQ